MKVQKHNSIQESGFSRWIDRGTKAMFAIPMATAVSWVLYSHLVIDHDMPLPDALPGERQNFSSQAGGRISFYVSHGGQGRPLVLIHSINAAASAYEMRPIYLHYRDRRPVYALELPGFGFSERSRRIYSPALYVNSILEFLSTQVGEPADVVALSLGCEFAAQAALSRPNLFSSLALISPSGFNQGKSGRASQKAGRGGWARLVYPLFAFRVWARPFFDLLATRASIEFFLKQSFTGLPPADLVDYDYLSAHQPGAEHAPLYFVTGNLFTSNVREDVYERLQVPTLVLYDRDSFVNFGMLPVALARNSYLQAVRLVPSLGLPHFEDMEATAGILDHFWS